MATPAGNNQEKKTPFCSRPTTEIRFAVGSGGMSDSKWKPFCSEDQAMVASVLKNVPLKCCAAFSISAVASTPFHSTSNETLAGTGKTGGMGGEGSPRP